MNFILPRPANEGCARGDDRWSVSTGSDQEKRSRLRTFKPNAILGWLLEIPLFESLESPSLLGCDPFVLLPLQPSVIFLLSFLASLYIRVTAFIIPTAHRRPRARGRTRRVSVAMITFTGGGSSVCFVTLPVIVSAAVAFVALGIRSSIIPTAAGT